MNDYFDKGIMHHLESELAQFEKNLEKFKASFENEEELRIFLEKGTEGLILFRVERKSNGRGLELGLTTSQLAELYSVNVDHIISQAVILFESPFWSCVDESTLSLDGNKAEKVIESESEIHFNALQKLIVEDFEKIATLYNKLQNKLSKKGATSIPLGKCLSIDHKNRASINVPYIKMVGHRA